MIKGTIFWAGTALGDEQMIGAVGVTVGAGAGGDEDCAIAGLKAAFGERVTLPDYRPANPAPTATPAR